MHLRRFFAVLALGLFAVAPAIAQTPAADLAQLVGRIQDKLRAGERTAPALSAELAAFDTLLAKYSADKTDAVAQILYMEAALYGEVFNDTAKAKELFTKLKADFPATTQAKNADAVLASYERRAQAAETKNALVGKAAPELNFKWSSQPGFAAKLSELKGKVVVLDFWATWCGPCIASFPNIRELATHYKGADVVVIGVTSLQGYVAGLQPARIDTKGDPQKEYALMPDFMKAKDMTWTVAFSEEEVFNPAYGVTGIPHMSIIAPDGTVRHSGLHPAAVSHAEKVTMINKLLKEFGKFAPATMPNE